ncbi:MAG: nucleotidyltransferase domain-containing protein [Proteiniphilum sp.]|uniref:nucleotidyltransferase family protein n=1 Tax=Proteiniphilum sp. TaxID=1926877 RepID=UPI002B1F2B7E|nr:nucleotidyltransferase domain-containing protein [Proteiniphilum sp.]MEA5129516.1 nucleotidyltransferase domain-containing protein [Proteiniphilum sp.]
MLPQSQIDIIINAMLPYNPVRIDIFGSVARGEDSENSDVDILYQLKEVIKFTNLLRLHEELEQKLNRKVDLVSEKYAHPKLKPYIMKDLKIIYSNET